jgi:hypothetical protein
VEAYLQYMRGDKPKAAPARPGRAPAAQKTYVPPGQPGSVARARKQMDLQDFDLSNPSHKARAEEILNEVESLSSTVFGNDEDGLVRLMVQAVKSGNLPRQALDLRINLKAKVLKMMQDESKASGGAINLGGRPSSII